MISSFLPYPLYSGGHVRLYNILKGLSKNHEITLICEKRDYQTEDNIMSVKKFCKEIITVERKKQWSIRNIANTAVSFYPFLLIGHSSKLMTEKIREAVSKEKFDLIHVETFYVMQNLPKNLFGKLPVVLTEHNIEYMVYKRFLDTMPVFMKPFLYLDILKIKYWENYFWRKATKLIAVSEDEKKLMKRRDTEIVENGVDTSEFKVSSAGWRTKFKQTKTVLFIGDFKWVQNRDSIEWILKDIWPQINSELRTRNLELNLKLWVVGRNIPEYIKKMTTDESVVFDENAPRETSEIFKKADILIAPIRVGGGTSFKILEAMASGVPVVTTNLGIEGIKAKDTEEVLISDDTQGIIDNIIGLLGNEKIYDRIVNNARRLIEEEYDWKQIVGKLEKVYESAIL